MPSLFLVTLISSILAWSIAESPLHQARDPASALAWARETVHQQRSHNPADWRDPVNPSHCSRFVGFTLNTEHLTPNERFDLCEKLHGIGRNLHVSASWGGPLKCFAIMGEYVQKYYYIE
jgi:hypothetical protein